jgi:hypothetical protein
MSKVIGTYSPCCGIFYALDAKKRWARCAARVHMTVRLCDSWMRRNLPSPSNVCGHHKRKERPPCGKHPPVSGSGWPAHLSH